MLKEDSLICFVRPLLSYQRDIITCDFEFALSLFFTFYGFESSTIFSGNISHTIRAHDFKSQNEGRNMLHSLILSEKPFFVTLDGRMIVFEYRRLDLRPQFVK